MTKIKSAMPIERVTTAQEHADAFMQRYGDYIPPGIATTMREGIKFLVETVIAEAHKAEKTMFHPDDEKPRAQPPRRAITDVSDWERAALVCREVAELTDRTSPDGWPDGMIVTANELASIIVDAFAEARRAGEIAMRERCIQAIAPIADNKIPDPHWDLDRVRRTDWVCAVSLCLAHLRALPLTSDPETVDGR